MSLGLVPFASIRDLLDFESSDQSDYPALTIIMGNMVYAFEEYLGRQLEQFERTKTIFIGSMATRMIKLDAVPVISVSSATLTTAGTDTVLTSGDYEITDYGLRLYGKVKNCKVSVTYIGGWLTADVPGAVTRAALLQVAYEFQSKEQIGAESVTTEGGSVSRPALGLLKEVKRLLGRYKHPLMEM